MDGQLSFDDLISMQQILIDAVPHVVREDCLSKMKITATTMSALLLYINACGRKPWRQTPLSPEKRQDYINDVMSSVSNLNIAHASIVVHTIPELADTPTIRRYTSCL